MHRLAGFAVLLLLAGCLREKVQYCNNGAYCPEPLVCTENAAAPFCGEPADVDQCIGMADESPCVYRTEKNGYCLSSVCTPCDPNFSFCRYDEWTAMAPVINGVRVTAELISAWASGPSDLYAVGRSGTVIHWNGRTWSALPSIAGDAVYETIWGFDANTIFAATTANYDGTRMFRFDGMGWVKQLPAPVGFMNAMWGASPSRMFAVGAAGELGTYDGAWTYSTQSASTLNGVWGTDASNAVAVGSNGVAIRFASGAWSSTPTGTSYLLRDVASAGGTDYAVGRVSSSMKLPVVVRHANNAWTDLTSTLPAGAAELNGVWVVSPTSVYAVGDIGILEYDGTTWTPAVPGTPLNEIFGTTTDIFAVGAAGTVLRLSR